jgi:hypothetical protein
MMHMPLFRRSRTASAASIALAACFAGGCVSSAGAAEQRGPLGRHSPIPPQTILYVSDASGNVFEFSNGTTRLLATISDGSSPQGLEVDSSGNLYVAESEASAINVYAPGALTATTILSDPGANPYGVAHCADGTTYVANPSYASANGNITYYAAGQTVPTGTIPDPAIGAAFSVSCDKNSNVYADYLDNVNYNVQIVKYGPQGSSITNTGFGAYLDYYGTVRVANDGQLAVSDTFNGYVLFFNPKSAPGTAPISRSDFGVAFYGFSLGASEDDVYGAAFNDSESRKAGCAQTRRVPSGEQYNTVFRANAHNLRMVKTYGQCVLEGPRDAFVYPGGNS